ncbi:MAG: FAD-dependent oxidoreductase, partial [Burkholderiales bacterium]
MPRPATTNWSCDRRHGPPPATAPERPSRHHWSNESMDRVDGIVIGAGVVGLACARALAQAGLDVVIVERETAYGTGVGREHATLDRGVAALDPA